MATVDPVDPEQSEDAHLRRLTLRCELRFPGAEIRPLPGQPPRLLIRPQPDDSKRNDTAEMIIGITGREPTEQLVLDFAAQADRIRNRDCDDTEAIAELVFAGSAARQALTDLARRHRLRLVRFNNHFQHRGPLPARRAADFSEFVEQVQTPLLVQGTPRYRPDLYIPQRFLYHEFGQAAVPQADLPGSLVHWMASESPYFVMLICDAGMGKSFLLRELARRLPEEVPDVQPLLVSLTAHPNVDNPADLVKAELRQHGSPYDFTPEEFASLLHEGQIALLLDGLDELAARDGFSTAPFQLRTLARAVAGKAKIVVAARAQHFENLDWDWLRQELGLVHEASHTIIIEPFSDGQINELLARALGTERAPAAASRLNALPWLLALCRSPRLLGLVVDGLAGGPADPLGTLLEAAGQHRPAGLLQELIGRWLTQESGRYGQTRMRGGLSPDESLHKLTLVACYSWQGWGYQPNGGVGLDALTYAVRNGHEDPGSDGPAEDQAVHELASATLLVRRNQAWEFLSPQISEYLVARRIAESLAGGGNGHSQRPRRAGARAQGQAPRPHAAHSAHEAGDLLGARVLTRFMLDILVEICPGPIAGWARHLPSRPSRAAVENASLILERPDRDR